MHLNKNKTKEKKKEKTATQAGKQTSGDLNNNWELEMFHE